MLSFLLFDDVLDGNEDVEVVRAPAPGTLFFFLLLLCRPRGAYSEAPACAARRTLLAQAPLSADREAARATTANGPLSQCAAQQQRPAGSHQQATATATIGFSPALILQILAGGPGLVLGVAQRYLGYVLYLPCS